MSCSNLPLSIPLPIDDNKKLIDVIQKAKDWSLMHGAGMRSKINFDSDALYFAPFILTPTSLPRKEFMKAIKIQPILNELMHKVAYDIDFLRSTLKETIKADEFTRNLFELYEDMLEEGTAQPISLGVLRSDLMLESRCTKINSNSIDSSNQSYYCWKQIEINAIASGFGHLGPISRDIQSYILQELDYGDRVVNLPQNNALEDICGAMITAWEMVGIPNGVILFVIENISYNICDQRFHEFKIREMNPNIKVIRRTLTEIYNEGKLGSKKELIIDELVVNLVYFRAGYDPNHYPSKNEWSARKLIELSTAIKCPSVQYHLAGTKKIQQALATPGVLQRFLNDNDKVELIENIFTGLYSLDNNEAGNAAYKMALNEPEKFVLKPQREGGGNNIYGKDICDALKKMSVEERSSWILMERIHPPISKGYMIRPGGSLPPPIVDLVSELGIFGAIIGDSKSIYMNKQAGHMFRTKLSTSNEGGVAAGQGALDSPYLVD